MNLALRDIRYRPGRFVLTATGLGLLLATVMAMGGIYQGLVVEALSIVRAAGADLWVVQKDTNGPFAESSRVPDDLDRVVRAVPGVRDAGAVAFQSLELRVAPKPIRVQLIGHRPGGLGAAPAVSDGRPLTGGRYEMVLGREAGVPVGTAIRVGRIAFTVVGLTDGVLSTSGDPVAYVRLDDAQAIQFLKPSEAVRNDRARLDTAVRAAPALADVPPAPLEPLVQNLRVANAILVRLEPWADAAVVRADIERWTHYRALTAADQEDVLAKSVIERGRRQTLLFRAILLVVSIVIIALILYTMTVEKTRDIATLKTIGTPDRTIAGLIVQQALALGLTGYALGALLIDWTYTYFPRRVVIVAFDQVVLLAIVVVICVVASVAGIRRALAIDPTTALAGGG
jgi:putative ABC transport system permease protein